MNKRNIQICMQIYIQSTLSLETFCFFHLSTDCTICRIAEIISSKKYIYISVHKKRQEIVVSIQQNPSIISSVDKLGWGRFTAVKSLGNGQDKKRLENCFEKIAEFKLLSLSRVCSHFGKAASRKNSQGRRGDVRTRLLNSFTPS